MLIKVNYQSVLELHSICYTAQVCFISPTLFLIFEDGLMKNIFKVYFIFAFITAGLLSVDDFV